MKKISQQELDAFLEKQKTLEGGGGAHDIKNVNLSNLVFSTKELDATLIAMSVIPTTNFDNSYSLYGITWIGNKVENCTFFDVPMNKCEVLDCNFRNCSFKNASLFRSDFTGTSFKNCNFVNIDLSTACLIRTSFVDCFFENVKISASKVISKQCDLFFNQMGDVVATVDFCPASIAAHLPCTASGFWFTPAKVGSRRYFKVGDVMPDLKSDYGSTVWQWDINQEPPKL